MEKILISVYGKDDIYLKYYEICSDNPPLVLIHAQGVDSDMAAVCMMHRNIM